MRISKMLSPFFGLSLIVLSLSAGCNKGPAVDEIVSRTLTGLGKATTFHFETTFSETTDDGNPDSILTTTWAVVRSVDLAGKQLTMSVDITDSSGVSTEYKYDDYILNGFDYNHSISPPLRSTITGAVIDAWSKIPLTDTLWNSYSQASV